MKKKSTNIILIKLLLLCFTVSNINSQSSDTSMTSVFSMTLEELMNTKVAIATKSEQPLSETPSSVSIITAEDIKNMGATEKIQCIQRYRNQGSEGNKVYKQGADNGKRHTEQSDILWNFPAIWLFLQHR
jgi:outer membrane receptor for ferrienterochelin and colicin